MAFNTYMLRCSDGSYYVGHTDDLDLRIRTHQVGALLCYTRTRRLVVMVWCENFPTRDEAFTMERRIKGWTRAKKEALIVGDWERISQLARGRGNTSATEVRGLRQAQAERILEMAAQSPASHTPPRSA